MCSPPAPQSGWVLKQGHLETALLAIVPSVTRRGSGGGGDEMSGDGASGMEKTNGVRSRGKPRAWQDLI